MERALIIGSSGGIGAALLTALQKRGVTALGLSRGGDGLDVTDPTSVAAALSGAEGPFDLIVLATGILAPEGKSPEKSLSAIDPAAMAQVMAVNAIGPAMVLQHLPPLLPRKARSVVAVLTARVGSIGDNALGGWYSYRASKAAANQIVRCAAIEMGRKLPEASIVALHPGTVATPFTANYPAHKKVPAQAAADNLLGVIGCLTPQDTGKFFDWKGEEIPW